jgi:hypothetical protein
MLLEKVIFSENRFSAQIFFNAFCHLGKFEFWNLNEIKFFIPMSKGKNWPLFWAQKIINAKEDMKLYVNAYLLWS